MAAGIGAVGLQPFLRCTDTSRTAIGTSEIDQPTQLHCPKASCQRWHRTAEAIDVYQVVEIFLLVTGEEGGVGILMGDSILLRWQAGAEVCLNQIVLVPVAFVSPHKVGFGFQCIPQRATAAAGHGIEYAEVSVGGFVGDRS